MRFKTLKEEYSIRWHKIEQWFPFLFTTNISVRPAINPLMIDLLKAEKYFTKEIDFTINMTKILNDIKLNVLK